MQRAWVVVSAMILLVIAAVAGIMGFRLLAEKVPRAVFTCLPGIRDAALTADSR